MQKRDPVSTPARRRRIIAEFAKKTLKLYAGDACKGVVRYRLHTKAALIIQCRARVFLAKCRVLLLRYEKHRKASIVAQSAVRRFLAVRRQKRLLADRLHRQRLRLNTVVHHLRDIRKQRLARIAMLIAMRLARERRERISATNIQRVFRGHLSRIVYRGMYEKHKAHMHRQFCASVKIQSRIRTFLAVKRYRYWSTRRRAIAIIQRCTMRWWIRRRFLQSRSAIHMQRLVRGHFGRARARRESQLRAEQWERVAALLCHQLQLDVVNELALKIAKETLPQERNMIIHVDVGRGLLSRLSTQGPAAVVLWCLTNSLLEYRQALGYRAGAVVQQVVRSVESALQQPSVPSIPAGDHSDNAVNHRGALPGLPDRVIALDKWDEGDATETPETASLPGAWGALAHGVASRALSPMASFAVTPSTPNRCPVGAAVSVDCVTSARVELHIATCAESPAHFLRSTVTIAFNSVVVDENECDPSDDTAAQTRELPVEEAGVQELKFRFKNALVYVNNPAPTLPSPPKHSFSPVVVAPVEEDIVIDDESSVRSSHSEDEEEENELEEKVVLPAVRPSTAVVRIVLRDPTPPPAPIDYDGKATTLQMMVRRRHRRRVRSVVRLQRAVRRSRRVYLWQELVYSTLEVAHDAATIVQSWLRRAAAQRLLARLQRDYFRAHYGHDFLLDEGTNWAAFGLPVPPSDSDNEDCGEGCAASYAVVPVAVMHLEEHLDAKLRQYVHTQGMLRVGEVVRLLDYPAPPPGCLFFSPGGATTATPPAGSQYDPAELFAPMLLSMPLLPDGTVGLGSAQAAVDPEVMRVLGELPCLSHEGRMRSRALHAAMKGTIHRSALLGARDAPLKGKEAFEAVSRTVESAAVDSTSALPAPTPSHMSLTDCGGLGDLHPHRVEVFAGDLYAWLRHSNIDSNADVSHTCAASAPVYAALAASL